MATVALAISRPKLNSRTGNETLVIEVTSSWPRAHAVKATVRSVVQTRKISTADSKVTYGSFGLGSAWPRLTAK